MRTLLPSLLLLFVLLWPSLAPAQGGRPAGVTTDLVTTEQMSETVSVFGQVVSGRQSSVAARISGIAVEVPLRVGDRVTLGDTLARLDTELLDIGLAQAEAEVTIAEAAIETVAARLERAEKAFERAQTLRANSTIAEAQLEDRASEFAEARGARTEALARVDAARTALRRARYDLDNASVRAPFDGVVIDVLTEIGQFVTVGSQVATLIDTGAMEVEANIPARYIDALQPGQSVSARTDSGGAIDLSLRAVLPTEFASTRTRPVRFDVVVSDSLPAVGEAVTLEVPVSAPREVAAVPKDALIQARGGWSVFVAIDGKAQPRPVEIGAALGDRFEVLSGLAPGEAVVIRGNERLRPGQDIMATPAGAAPGAAPGGPPAAAEGPAPTQTEAGTGSEDDASHEAEGPELLQQTAAAPASATTASGPASD